ncbi:myosin-15-like [Impatiens glandulifera]|uniref:myosin-15-like n=1 Tax=Impatiens glandulifera TaxID=253017 RepID=UPI001FB07BBB|nr:myosin-15-like [Impatiens glandulifera]
MGANPENDEADEEGSEEEEEDDQTKADIIARRLLEAISLRAEKVGDLYREWHEYRFNKLYKHILPGFTDEECFKRMKEVEDIVMSLTNAETIHEALGRTAVIRPRAQLQKLTVRIRKIKERYEEETPEDTLTPLVLKRLEKARGELDEEIERLEVMCRQHKLPHSPVPQIDKGQTHSATPIRADPVITETDERTETPLAGQFQHEQPEVSEPGITEDRVKFLLQEFAESTVHPLEERMKRTVSMALRFANNTRNKLVMVDDRFSQIDADYREDAVLRDNHLHRTEALEVKTLELKDDFDRLERETDQRLTEVAGDLVGTTLDRVSELEKKNAGLEDRNDKLEADLRALTAQVDELLKAKMNADIAVVEANERAAKDVQDALNEEARLAKETPQLTEKERAERERRTWAKYPGLEESVAAQAAKDAERLDNERQRLEGFTSAHKKQKEAPSSSVPAKRKRKSSKKAQVAELLNEVTDTVIESQPDQATHTEEEDEEHLEPRPTRQRVSRPDKKKRNKDLMARFNLSDSE